MFHIFWNHFSYVCPFMIVVFSWWIDLFLIIYCSVPHPPCNFPCLEIHFALCLFIATLVFFWSKFSCYIFSHPPFTYLYNYIWNEFIVDKSLLSHIFLIHSEYLCLLQGHFKPFTANVMINVVGFQLSVLSFIYCLLLFVSLSRNIVFIFEI